jgi:hypothetical protein
MIKKSPHVKIPCGFTAGASLSLSLHAKISEFFP